MAQMVPDSMPPGKSVGEQMLFSRLQILPDDCLVYYEPAVARRYPDFVVFIPDRGLLVIEVKGWRAHEILGGDSHTIHVRARDGAEPVAHANPIRQVREYMYGLMDVCRKKVAASSLLNQEGKHKGKFVFPFASIVVLTQITRDELVDHPAGDLTTVLPDEQVIDFQEADAWGCFTGAQLKERLSGFFNPAWSFLPLKPEQLSALRTVLDPVVLVPPTPTELAKIKDLAGPVASLPIPEPSAAASLRALDLEQERLARTLGSGHRLIFGVAGSGKTIVLVARAKYLAEAMPSSRVLVLCYNVSLRTYLRALLDGVRNVDVYTYHGWGMRNGVSRQESDTAEGIGPRLLQKLEGGSGDAAKYDAVLIDEAQDFAPSWFSCAKAAMKEGDVPSAVEIQRRLE